MRTIPGVRFQAPRAGTARARRTRRRGRSHGLSLRASAAFEWFEPRVMLDATPVLADIDALGFGANRGQIQPTAAGQSPQVDVYQYDAPVTQSLDVRVEAQGSLESATLSIFSQDGHLLLSAPGETGQPITEVRFDVVAGTTYDFDVAAGAASLPSGLSGPYRLVFDDFSDRSSSAFPLTVPSGATAVEQTGAIDPAGDIDWFKVTAPVTGFLTADLAAASGGTLEGQLLVEDSTGAEDASDTNAAGSLESRVTGFAVVQGQTYYILASASASAISGHRTGQYDLNLSFAVPAAGHGFATATPLNPTPMGGASVAGLIAVPGLGDYYRYVAPLSTSLVIREESLVIPGALPSGSRLDTLLTVYDAAGQPVPGGTSYDAQWVDDQGNLQDGSEVRVPVVANQSYYIVAGAFGAGTGAYDLTVIPDGGGHTVATAVPLTLSSTGALNASGSILFPGDVEFYRFVAPISGAMTIQQDAVGFGLDSFLTILDASQHVVTFDDDSDSKVTGFYKNSLVQFPVAAGQTFFVEAAAFPNLDGSGATGSFTLRFATGPSPPPDDQPDTFAKAEPVNVSTGFARVTGTIESEAEVNVFRFVAPISESIQVELDPAAANDFQGYLYAFDDDGNQVANDYNLSLLQNDTTSTVGFNVVAGRTYYVQAAAYRGRTGAYDLRFAAGPTIPAPSDGLGRTFDTATLLTLDAADTATIAGTIEQPGDVNVFQFQADRSETLTVRQFAAPGSRLDTFLIAFSDSQTEIGEDDDSDVVLTETGAVDHVIDRDSVIHLNVVAGKTYYLKATSAGSSTGRYFLALSSAHDDFGDRIGDVSPPLDPRNPDVPVPVQQIPLDASGAGTQAGVIDMPGDLDAFQFVAPVTGLMTVQQQAAPGSSLDSQLFAFDSSRQPLANNNDFHGTYNSLVQFNVAAGQTYYLKAGAYGTSVGAYVLTLSIQPPSRSAPGHSFATATHLTVSAATPTVQQGQIVAAGDADVYQFVAPASGLITIQQQAAPGSPLDSYLYAYDGSQPVNNFDGLQALIASNDDSQGTLDSLVQFNVTAGQTYYLRAAGFGTSIGAYILTLKYGAATPPTEVGHTFADAGPITLDPAGYGSQVGVIASPGEVDLYRFVAPYTGTLTIRQDAPSAGTIADKFSPSKSILDSVLTVFDDTQTQIAQNDDNGDTLNSSLNSLVNVPIVAGRTYYVQAAGFGATTGRYELLFNDDVPNDFADASLIQVDSKLLSATVFGTIEVPTDVDLYRFVAPVTGPIAVTQQATGTSQLDSYLFLFDDSQTLIASNDDETIDPAGPGGGLTIPDSLVQANVVAGRTYYIRAASSSAHLNEPGRSTTGAYRIQVTFPAYDFGATFADARTIPPPGSAPATQEGTILQIGEVDMFQFAAASAGRVTIDVEANPGTGPVLDPLLVAYDAQGNELARGASELTLGVQAQSLHFIQVGGYGASTGGFQLTYSEINGSGLGFDFGSAIPVGLSGSGSGTAGGVLGPAGDLNVFQFTAPVSGQATVALDVATLGSLAAFTVNNGTPTQVGGEPTAPGLTTFDINQGQTYFVRVTSTGLGGSYRLEIQTSAAPGPAPDLQLPGKVTFVQLGQSFIATIPVTGPSSNAQQLTANEITAALVSEFIASQQGHLSGSYVLVWTDPVDFVLTDAKARQAGYTADRGPISEIGGGYNSGAGVLKLVIAPATSGSYELDLIGVGEGPVLFGATLITAAGLAVEPQSTPGSALPITLESMTDLVVVLGFNTPTPTPTPTVTPTPTPTVTPTPTPTPTPTSPSPASTSASPSINAGPLFSPAIAFVAAHGGVGEASGAAESLVPEPSSVTTLLAPTSSSALSVSDLSHDELAASTLPNPVDQAPVAAGMDQPAGLVGVGVSGVVARMQEFVQPLVRGFTTLGGHLRAIFKSIFTSLSRPRVASEPISLRGAEGGQLNTDEVALSARPATMQESRLELWDLVLNSQSEDWLPIPEPDTDMMTRAGTADQDLFLVALMAIALREVRTSPSFPSRISPRHRKNCE